MNIGIFGRSRERDNLVDQTPIRDNFSRVLLLVFLLGLADRTLAQAAPSANLQDVRDRIDQLEVSLANEETKFKTAREEITEIERRLHSARQQKEKFRLELETKSKRIDSLRSQRDRFNRAYDATTEAMKKTLLARFMLWRQPRTKNIVEQYEHRSTAATTYVFRLHRNRQ